MEILSYMDLSTAHVRAVTMHGFLGMPSNEGTEWPITIAPYDLGAFVSVPGEYIIGQMELEGTVPPDLVTVLRFARERDCDVIRFDRDGDITDELPVYDW